MRGGWSRNEKRGIQKKDEFIDGKGGYQDMNVVKWGWCRGGVGSEWTEMGMISGGMSRKSMMELGGEEKEMGNEWIWDNGYDGDEEEGDEIMIWSEMCLEGGWIDISYKWFMMDDLDLNWNDGKKRKWRKRVIRVMIEKDSRVN